MDLDDLMEVWRSQDVAPLHDVNKTLLHLALRQEEAKLQKERRIERWIIYVVSAGVVAGMSLFLAVMIYPYDDDVLNGWDYAIPIVGAVAILLWAGAMYVRHRAQAVREQSFGESLRDQLNRRIAQLDYQTASVVRLADVLLTLLPGVVCPTAIILASLRINEKPFSDEWVLIVGMVFLGATSLAASAWEHRRSVQRDLLPRKRRLEALLKELDTP